MRLLVCGGRDYDDTLFLVKELDKLHASRPVSLVIEGGALGADRLGRAWARTNGITVHTVEADWKRFGKAAGHIRNGVMLMLIPDLVVAFHGGRGTANMIKQAKAAGVKVFQPAIECGECGRCLHYGCCK